MHKTKISFHLTSDTEIPLHLRNEAVELFLNHLKEHYVKKLLIDDSFFPISEKPHETKNGQTDVLHSLEILGAKCPLYYKNRKELDNVATPY